MIAMRNLPVHEDGDVDAAIMWDVVREPPGLLEVLAPLVPPTDQYGAGS